MSKKQYINSTILLRCDAGQFSEEPGGNIYFGDVWQSAQSIG